MPTLPTLCITGKPEYTIAFIQFRFISSAFNIVAGHLRCYVCKNCKGDLGSQQGQCLKCATVFRQGKLLFELFVIKNYQQ